MLLQLLDHRPELLDFPCRLVALALQLQVLCQRRARCRRESSGSSGTGPAVSMHIGLARGRVSAGTLRSASLPSPSAKLHAVEGGVPFPTFDFGLAQGIELFLATADTIFISASTSAISTFISLAVR